MAGSWSRPCWTLCLVLCALRQVCGTKCDVRTVWWFSQTNTQETFLRSGIEEWIQCLARTCEDLTPAFCSDRMCDSGLDMSELTGVLSAIESPSDDAIITQESLQYFAGALRNFGALKVHQLCPKTCQACELDRPKPHVVPCELGWSHADGACFKYNYGGPTVGTQPMVDWFEAEASCQAEGAHLATIETSVQEHMVFQLVLQRPKEARTVGLWAWVGLWSGPASCNGTGNWTWVGAPRSGVDGRLAGGARCACDGGAPACDPTVFFTNDLAQGQTMALSTTSARHKRRAWICSKPASLGTVTRGTCQDAGLLPITDPAKCQTAASALLGMDRLARRRDHATLPYGCFVDSTAIGGVRMSNDPASQTVDVDGEWVPVLLCQHANATVGTSNVLPEATGAMVDNSILWDTSHWQKPVARRVDESLSETALALVLVFGFLPAAGLLMVLSRDALFAINWSALRALRPSRLLGVDSGDKLFLMVVRARLCRWRDTTANVAALMIMGLHLAELLRTTLVAETICVDDSSLPRLREMLVAVHLANVWAAAALLALRRCHVLTKAVAPRVAFVLVATALELAETALLGEQALLVESRFYRQLLWRLLVGACATPGLALLGNALFSLSMCAMYKVLVPEGMAFTVGSTGSALVSQHGCNSLWQVTSAEEIVRLVRFCARIFDVITGNMLESSATIIEETLKKQTSINDFVAAEVVLFAIVVACLLFLHFVMFRDISQSLRLQSSADKFAAVSQMLGTLCDATFLLSADYRIVSPAPKLDTILHVWPSPTGMAGQNFCDCAFHAEDRDRLVEALREGSSQKVLEGEAMYLDLRCASNGKVRVQLLCAQFANDAGERRILCGVTELHSDDHGPSGETDRLGRWGPAREMKMPRAIPIEGKGTPVEVPPHGDLSDSGSESSGSSRRGTRSSDESCSARRHRKSEATHGKDKHGKDVSSQDLHIVVDAGSSRVYSSSRSFQDFIGVEPKADFHLTKTSPDPEELLAALRACVAGAGSCEEGTVLQQEMPIVLLRFWATDGGIQERPYELLCKVEVAANVKSSSSTDSTHASPIVRLHVQRTRGLSSWQLRGRSGQAPAKVIGRSSSSDRVEL